jgi:hypothetical protein
MDPGRAVAVLLAWLAFGCTAMIPPLHAQDTAAVFPQGTAFPLQLYSLQPDSDIGLVAPNGWNIGHRYGWAEGGAGADALNQLLQTFAANGIEGLPALPAFGTVASGRAGWAESDIAGWIQALAPNTNVAYWDLPEELRYWMPDEWAIVQNYIAWTRAYDPQSRPNYMYIPTHYTKDQVTNYVPYLDVIPASAYADYAGWPHAWVRWRMEETLRGIDLAGAPIGSDYINGAKTPVGIVQLFVGSNGVVPAPEQTYHDFWQLIASGARGIFVFSYFHRNDSGGALIPNWNRLQQAAAQMTGPEQLGSVVLFGTRVSGVTSSVLAGPAQTASFIPTGYSTPVQFPSIHLLAQRWNGRAYIFAVNSTDQAVTTQISGVPTTSTSATVLFQDRNVSIDGGGFTDVLPAWGVNVYKIDGLGDAVRLVK